MRNQVVACDVNRRLRDQLAHCLLRPGHAFRQRGAGHADADMLHVLHEHARGLSRLFHHTLQVFAALLFAHVRELARGTSRLSQELCAVAHRAFGFCAAGIHAEVQCHKGVKTSSHKKSFAFVEVSSIILAALWRQLAREQLWKDFF